MLRRDVFTTRDMLSARPKTGFPFTRCKEPCRHDEQSPLLLKLDGAREEDFFHGHAEASRF